MSQQFDKQVERNLRGIELQKTGNIEQAIKLYEQNIKENFEGSHPYNALAVIYRQRKQINDEIRVLEKAVFVFDKIVYNLRADKSPKLIKFRERLRKAKIIKQNGK